MARQEKKKANPGRGGNFDVDKWRARQVRRRTMQFFYDQSDEFEREHENDTDEQLIDYVKAIALGMGRMPKPIEVPGGYYIEQRLGRWLTLAKEFGVPGYEPGSRYKETTTEVWRLEYERQEALFRQERRKLRAEKARNKGKKM